MSDTDKKTKIRPLGDKILVKRIEQNERTTAGGIMIPGSAKDEKAIEGEVIAVGEGSRDDKGNLIPVSLQVGDHVVFKSWAGTNIKAGEEEFLIVPASDIVAVFESVA